MLSAAVRDLFPCTTLTCHHPPCFKLSLLCLSVFAASLVSRVGASIHDYSNDIFIRRSNSYFFHGGNEGLYASEVTADAPVSRSVEENYIDGRSFIRFESIVFRRTKESAERKNAIQPNTGLVEAVILEVEDRDKIGGAYLNSDAVCCTPELSRNGSCKLGEVIIRHDPQTPDRGPRRVKTFFEGRNEEAAMDFHAIQINKTGMYYLYFIICDPELVGTVINGRTVWRNPNGYLPGKMLPLMTFYGLMSLAYLVLGVVWFLYFLRYWKDVMQLHYCITGVIGLGMCEMALWYHEYANHNASGIRPMVITIWAVTFSVVKKTVSRLLLLVVAMGYGVVLPKLGGISGKGLLLGAVYFLFCEALELVEHLGNINDFVGQTRLFLVLPVSLLDASFIIWIFSSLSQTLEKLQVRRGVAKFSLYRRFTNTLAITVLLSVAWIGYELYFSAVDPLGEKWQKAWIISAFWNLLSFSLLIIICVLWAPSRHPIRHDMEEAEDSGEGEAAALTNAEVVMVAGDSANKLERKERRVQSMAELQVLGHSESLAEVKIA